jgi:hypothetical protein
LDAQGTHKEGSADEGPEAFTGEEEPEALTGLPPINWFDGSPGHQQGVALLVAKGTELEGNMALLVGFVAGHLKQPPPPTIKWPMAQLCKWLNGNSAYLPEPMGSELADFAEETNALYVERNRFVHCKWFLTIDVNNPDYLGYMYIDRAGKLDMGHASPAQLFDLATKLEVAVVAAEKWRFRVRAVTLGLPWPSPAG